MKILKSIGAILAGMLVVIVLSLAADEVLHATGLMERGPLPMRGAEALILGLLAYRLIFGLAGSYLAARLAPSRPLLHAMIFGCIGLVLSLMGAAANAQQQLGPAWYPWALVATALPSAWLAGHLAQRRSPAQAAA